MVLWIWRVSHLKQSRKNTYTYDIYAVVNEMLHFCIAKAVQARTSFC